MSLRKSPTMTPARIETHRRNARKSTGPRTERGKAQSRMNRLKLGTRSAFRRRLLLALLHAPPCSVEATARALLTPEQLRHPLFAGDMEVAHEAERATTQDCAHILRQTKKGLLLSDERSLNVVEKPDPQIGMSVDVADSKGVTDFLEMLLKRKEI